MQILYTFIQRKKTFVKHTKQRLDYVFSFHLHTPDFPFVSTSVNRIFFSLSLSSRSVNGYRDDGEDNACDPRGWVRTLRTQGLGGGLRNGGCDRGV